MNKNHSPETKTPARTTFALTDNEVAQALVNYVKSQGEIVPQGKRHVWFRDHHTHDNDSLATLVVDHDEVIEPEKVE